VVHDVKTEKVALRAEIRERRRIMPPLERSIAERKLFDRMKRTVKKFQAKKIGCYISANDEPATLDFLSWASGSGISVLVPAARQDGLMDWVVFDETNIVSTDDLGLPVPESTTYGPIILSELDLIFVPAACVAMDGMRLGWGRGYFDRALGALSKEAPTFAVLFDHEVVDDVPREVHDQKVKGAITPERFIDLS